MVPTGNGNLVSKRYFSDHDVETPFNNQRDLATRLRDMGKIGIIETDEVNPLTLRLFNTKEGLDIIKKCISKLSQELPEYFRPYYTGRFPQSKLSCTPSLSGSPGYLPYWDTSITNWQQDPRSLTLSPSYCIEVVSHDHVRIMSKDPIYGFHLHRGLYTFFSNLDSSLDRIRRYPRA